MKKLNEKLPFGARVNEKIASQSCSSRCSATCTEPKSPRTRSYCPLSCVAHLGVSPKLRFPEMFSDGGAMNTGPPIDVLPPGVKPVGGAFCACSTQVM